MTKLNKNTYDVAYDINDVVDGVVELFLEDFVTQVTPHLGSWITVGDDDVETLQAQVVANNGVTVTVKLDYSGTHMKDANTSRAALPA